MENSNHKDTRPNTNINLKMPDFIHEHHTSIQTIRNFVFLRIHIQITATETASIQDME